MDDTTSVNVYYHKNAEIEHITITGPEEASGTGDEQLTAPDPQPTQMSLAQVGGSDFELSEENAKTILQILDSGRVSMRRNRLLHRLLNRDLR